MKTNLNMIHFNISLTVNQSEYNWIQPYADSNITFSIPVELFDEKKLSGLISNKLSELAKSFLEKKVEFEEQERNKKLEADKAAEQLS